MEANTATIGETIANMLSEGQRLGFRESYIWNTWVVRTNTIANYYKERGACIYDPTITSDFLSMQEARYKAGEISGNYFKSVRITVRRLNEFYLTGTLRADATRKGTRYILGGGNMRLIELLYPRVDTGKIRRMMQSGSCANISTILRVRAMNPWKP